MLKLACHRVSNLGAEHAKAARPIARSNGPLGQVKRCGLFLLLGRGLFLLVQPTGMKQWMVRFQTAEDKRGNRMIGICPDMGVADAHNAADDLRQRVRMGASRQREARPTARFTSAPRKPYSRQKSFDSPRGRYRRINVQDITHESAKFFSATG